MAVMLSSMKKLGIAPGAETSPEKGLVGHQKEQLGGSTGAQDQVHTGPAMSWLPQNLMGDNPGSPGPRHISLASVKLSSDSDGDEVLGEAKRVHSEWCCLTLEAHPCSFSRAHASTPRLSV